MHKGYKYITHLACLQFKKDKDDDDSNGNDSNSASRGNWWQGTIEEILIIN